MTITDGSSARELGPAVWHVSRLILGLIRNLLRFTSILPLGLVAASRAARTLDGHSATLFRTVFDPGRPVLTGRFFASCLVRRAGTTSPYARLLLPVTIPSLGTEVRQSLQG